MRGCLRPNAHFFALASPHHSGCRSMDRRYDRPHGPASRAPSETSTTLRTRLGTSRKPSIRASPSTLRSLREVCFKRIPGGCVPHGYCENATRATVRSPLMTDRPPLWGRPPRQTRTRVTSLGSTPRNDNAPQLDPEGSAQHPHRSGTCPHGLGGGVRGLHGPRQSPRTLRNLVTMRGAPPSSTSCSGMRKAPGRRFRSLAMERLDCVPALPGGFGFGAAMQRAAEVHGARERTRPRPPGPSSGLRGTAVLAQHRHGLEHLVGEPRQTLDALIAEQLELATQHRARGRPRSAGRARRPHRRATARPPPYSAAQRAMPAHRHDGPRCAPSRGAAPPTR